jgi:hypothetical protein
MKKISLAASLRLLALFLFAAAMALSAHAQSSSGSVSIRKAPNPAFLNQVYYYWTDSILPCPKADGRMESKMKALGFGGMQMGYTMDGEKSALRIHAADSLHFAVRLASTGMMDPSTMFQLFRFEPKKGSRQAIVSSQSRYGGNSNPKNQVSFDIQKSGTDVFILIPSVRLAPGEYGFMNKMQMNGGGMNMSYTFYSFGIDP